jgi:thiamine pyrophosphate-dependent acetolactate synthase large subunit-like protein
MYMKEMPTAVQYKTPVLWIVLDNAAIHWVKWITRATGEKYYAVDFEAQPDLVAIAKASGVHAEQIASPDALGDALGRAKRALADGVPAMLDCLIDTWDYPKGFVDYHREVWGFSQPEARVS